MNVLADIGDFSSYPNTSLIVTRSFLDMSLVEELEREGFIRKLYAN